MIKPEDCKASIASDRHEREMNILEKACDSAIRAADDRDEWPAKVGRLRTPIGHLAISQTIAKYRAAGWDVIEPFGSDIMHIRRPTR